MFFRTTSTLRGQSTESCIIPSITTELSGHSTQTVLKWSKTLVGAIKESISGNSLTHVSKSYGGMDNLVFVETADGREWAAVYCLVPLDDGCSVRMEVLSCHPKVIDQKSISRRNLSYFARMCLYHKIRTPKA